MIHPSLGPDLQAFRPNWWATTIILAAGSVPCLLAFGVARELKTERIAWIIFFALTALLLGIVLRQAFFRVWVHDRGISWRGIFADGEMRWPEIARVHFSSYAPHLHLHFLPIPLGTFYRLKLVSQTGQRISLGERIREADVLAGWIRQRAPSAIFD